MGKGALPEYATAEEVEALLRSAPHGPARLVMLVMWRAGLRVSEALDLQLRDLLLDDPNPVLRVRRGKGNQARLVPVHPELSAALRTAIDYAPSTAGSRRPADTSLFTVRRRTVSRWIAQALEGAARAGALDGDRHISAHTFRHSYARHMLANGVPINVLSRWLGHRSIDTTLVYLELLPDPTGRLEAIP